MTRATTFIIAAIACSTAVAESPPVTFESPCECRDNHGKQRWAEKNDPVLPPTDASAIQPVTPSDIFNWQGPTEYLVPSSERIWSEQKWYALTGRVVELRAEEDGAGSTPGISKHFQAFLNGLISMMVTRTNALRFPENELIRSFDHNATT